MSSDSRVFSDEERADIIKDIMAQNEIILEQHRKKIELEFQGQLRGILTDIGTSGDGVGTDTEYENGADDSHEGSEHFSPAKPPSVNSASANLTNKQFFHAAQHSTSAPHILIYDGDQHTATVRASQELTGMGEHASPAVVSTSQSKVINNKEIDRKVAEAKSPTPANLKMYSQPLFRKSKSDVKKEQADKDRRLKDKQRGAEIDEKIASQQMINRVSSPHGYGNSEEVDALMYRVSGTTKTALLKSSSIVGDVAAQNKKIMKKYKRNSSAPDHSSRNDTDGRGTDTVDHSSARPSSSPKTKSRQRSRHEKQQQQQQLERVVLLPPVQAKTPRQEEFAGTRQLADTGPARGVAKGYVMQDEGEEREDGARNGVFQDKRTWENQLARHILSVYATSQVEDVKKSRAVLEFIDLKSKTKPSDLVQEGIFDKCQLNEQKQTVMRATLRKSKDTSGVDTGCANNEQTDDRGTEAPSVLKLSSPEPNKKSKRKPKKHQFREVETDPVATVGQDGLLVTKTLSRKERDDVVPLKAAEESKVTRVGLVRAPAKCFPIWFVSSGDMYAEWTSLPEGDKLQSHLDSLLEKKKYRDYLDTVDGLLENNWINAFFSQSGDPVAKKTSHTVDTGQKKRKPRAATPPRRRRMDLTEIVFDEEPPLTTEQLKVLFRQLVLVANAFAVNCIEKKEYDSAMMIIRMAERWAGREELFTAEIRCELKAFINRTLAYYFYRTKKAGAAINHTKLAMAAFLKIGTEADNATSLLHMACCQFQTGKFKDAHGTLYKFLGMAEEGRIAFSESEPKELCLVAVAYHNLAVVQLKLQVPDVAAKSSQNARKIARLCLSYSNRWINTFHWTHQLCLADVKYELENNFKLTADQVKAMNELTKILYEPFPS